MSESLLQKQIEKYLKRDPTRFHSPAHAGLWDSRDLSEVEGLDDLQNPVAAIAESQEHAARLFGAAKTFFLVAGASQGMQIACMALSLSINTTKPVLVARNIHKSTLAGIILAGLEITWFEPDWNEELGLFTRVEKQLEDSKKINENYSGLIITNPSYEGFYSKIPELKIPIIVDEAHGAHFHFSQELPKPALNYGADIVVQSWHKTLGSLTQTGALHLSKQSKITIANLEKAYKLIQTTSPSYLLLANICRCVDIYQSHGEAIIQESLALIKTIELAHYNNDDPFRKIFTSSSLSGEELDYQFAKSGIELEAVGTNHVLAFINVGNKDKDIKRLQQLQNLDLASPSNKIKKPKSIVQTQNMREAFLRKSSCKIKAPCPPGIALEVPGQSYAIS